MTVAEWLRQVLRSARRQHGTGDPRKKLAVVRAAVGHGFPTGAVDQMLAEIDRGYVGPDR